MSLRNILFNAVATINTVTKDVHSPVIHRAWIGQDGYGKPVYASPTLGSDGLPLRGIVDLKQRLRNLDSGRVVMTKAHIVFTEPVPVNGTPGRSEPIDKRDLIILQDGTTGPIADVDGFIDRATGHPYFSQVWLGSLNYS